MNPADDAPDDRRLWQLAVDAAGVGAFDWELASDTLRWDERLLALFGLDHTTFGGTIGAFSDLVHPDDRDRVQRAMSEAIESCGEYVAEYRVVRPDGSVRWVAARGLAVAGPDGSAERLLGAAYDTTVVREGEARVARTLDAMPTAFFHLDRDWRFTYANSEARELLGAIGTDVVGHVVWELFPAAVGTVFEDEYRGSVATGTPGSFEAYYPPPLDAWYEVRCWPTPDGLSVYFLEVTERHRAQDLLERASGRRDLLAEVSRALVETLDADEVATRLAQLLVPGLADWCVVTMVDGFLPAEPTDDRAWRNRLRDLGWWHQDPAGRVLVRQYAHSRIEALTDDSLVATALRTRAPVVIGDHATERITAVLTEGPARDLIARLAPGSVAIVPLTGRGRAAGLISVFRDEGREPFGADDLDLLADVASRAGLALDNVSLYTGQREVAESLQRSLLTEPPRVAGLEIEVRYEPASDSAQVGGDWYDAYVRPDGAVDLVIGDVIGHDAVAAASMGQLRGLLRGIAVTAGEGPADTLQRVEDAAAVLGVDALASAVLARVDPARSTLSWSNAGHLPPVLVRRGPDGVVSATPLEGAGPDPMLGLHLDLGADLERGGSTVELAAGDVVLMFTDGLVERRGESLDVGMDRLCEVLPDLADRPLPELCDLTLRRMLPPWTEDDIAVVAVRVAAPTAQASPT